MNPALWASAEVTLAALEGGFIGYKRWLPNLDDKMIVGRYVQELHRQRLTPQDCIAATSRFIGLREWPSPEGFCQIIISNMSPARKREFDHSKRVTVKDEPQALKSWEELARSPVAAVRRAARKMLDGAGQSPVDEILDGVNGNLSARD